MATATDPKLSPTNPITVYISGDIEVKESVPLVQIVRR